MDDKLAKVYKKLKQVRDRTDLTLRPSPYLRDTFTGFDGKEYPLKVRYYQIQGILHLVAMNRFLLGDDTGLGKTLQTIIALCYIWDKNPDTKVIVLTNKSAVTQWANEFAKFTRGIKPIVCMGTPPKRRKARDLFETATGPTVLVMGYRSAVGDFSDMQNWKDFIFITGKSYLGAYGYAYQEQSYGRARDLFCGCAWALWLEERFHDAVLHYPNATHPRKPQADTYYCGLSSESGETV